MHVWHGRTYPWSVPLSMPVCVLLLPINLVGSNGQLVLSVTTFPRERNCLFAIYIIVPFVARTLATYDVVKKHGRCAACLKMIWYSHRPLLRGLLVLHDPILIIHFIYNMSKYMSCSLRSKCCCFNMKFIYVYLVLNLRHLF